MANNIIKGAHFHHAALKVNDFDKTIEFYQKLGFTVHQFWHQGEDPAAMVDIGSGEYFEIFGGGTNEPPAGRFFHIAIGCDNCDEAFEAAVNAGAKPRIYPRDHYQETDTVPIDVRLAFAYGPDGEELEFFQIKK